jgi:hypothetical protein
MIVIFVAFLALVSGGSLLMKDREFSPNENRYLAEPPRLTVDNILSGKFQDGLENYLRDQICFRDGWITVKTGIQKVCKDTDIGGAYVGKDGYDFEKITPEDVDEKQIARNVKAVQDFFAKAPENTHTAYSNEKSEYFYPVFQHQGSPYQPFLHKFPLRVQ